MGLGFRGIHLSPRISLSRSVCPSLPPSLVLLPSGQEILKLHAAQAVTRRTRFPGRRGVGCTFTACNWFKCINIRGAILCLHTLTHIRGFALARVNSDDLNYYNSFCFDSQLCFSGGFEENIFFFFYDASHVGYKGAAVTSCKKIAISKCDIEPTVLNVYFSQWLSQINLTTS